MTTAHRPAHRLRDYGPIFACEHMTAFVTACGPSNKFAVAHARTAPAGDGGCPPSRMSSALGCAWGSPLISLRRAPAVPGLESWRSASREQPTRTGSGRWGALRSEIKEERRAQPDSGDIRGAARPTVPISRNCLHANAKVCNGPRADSNRNHGLKRRWHEA